MPIKNLPVYLRPREKALVYGLHNLNDIELLAIYIKSGTKEYDALDISKFLFEEYRTFQNIDQASWKNLQKAPGIGEVKSLEIKVLFEISRRLIQPNLQTKITSYKEAANFAFQRFKTIKDDNSEKFLVILLSVQNEIMHSQIVYKGTKKNISVDPKEIIALNLKHDSSKFYCIHNHPSNILKPSISDINVTKSLYYCAELFNIEFCGHIIVDSKK